MSIDKVIHIKDLEGQVLKSFSLEDRDQAFIYLKDLESWGVDAILDEPSLPETLINALGAGDQERQELKESIKEEIEDHHDDSCSFSRPDKKLS